MREIDRESEKECAREKVMKIWKSLMSVCLFQKAGNSPRLCLVSSTFTKVVI